SPVHHGDQIRIQANMGGDEFSRLMIGKERTNTEMRFAGIVFHQDKIAVLIRMIGKKLQDGKGDSPPSESSNHQGLTRADKSFHRLGGTHHWNIHRISLSST